MIYSSFYFKPSIGMVQNTEIATNIRLKWVNPFKLQPPQNGQTSKIRQLLPTICLRVFVRLVLKGLSCIHLRVTWHPAKVTIILQTKENNNKKYTTENKNKQTKTWSSDQQKISLRSIFGNCFVPKSYTKVPWTIAKNSIKVCKALVGYQTFFGY